MEDDTSVGVKTVWVAEAGVVLVEALEREEWLSMTAWSGGKIDEGGWSGKLSARKLEIELGQERDLACLVFDGVRKGRWCRRCYVEICRPSGAGAPGRAASHIWRLRPASLPPTTPQLPASSPQRSAVSARASADDSASAPGCAYVCWGPRPPAGAPRRPPSMRPRDCPSRCARPPLPTAGGAGSGGWRLHWAVAERKQVPTALQAAGRRQR